MSDDPFYIDDASLLNPGPEVERRASDYMHDVDDAIAGYDPQGRSNGFRGAVYSPVQVPASPMTTPPPTVDLVEPEGDVEMVEPVEAETPPPQQKAEDVKELADDGDGGAAAPVPVPVTPIPKAEFTSPSPPKKEKKSKKSKKAKKVEKVEKDEPKGDAPPPTKKRPASEMAEDGEADAEADAEVEADVDAGATPARPKKRRKSKKKDKKKDASPHAPTPDPKERDAFMRDDDEAEVEDEETLTKVLRLFVKQVYEMDGWRPEGNLPENIKPTDARVLPYLWMPVKFVLEQLRNDPMTARAVAASGYSDIEQLLLASCGQTMDKMTKTAKAKAHRLRKKGVPEAEDIDCLAAKYIGDGWCFRLYETIIGQYEEEAGYPPSDDDMGALSKYEKYECDSFVASDGDSVSMASDDFGLNEYLTSSGHSSSSGGESLPLLGSGSKKSKKSKKLSKKSKKSKKAKKPKSRLKKSPSTKAKAEAETATDGASTSDGDALDTLLSEDTLTEGIVSASGPPALMPDAASDASEPTVIDKPWSVQGLRDMLVTPKGNWKNYEMVEAGAMDALRPVARKDLSGKITEGFESMTASLLTIARHVLTPMSASLTTSLQMMNVVGSIAEDVSETSKTVHADILRVLNKMKQSAGSGKSTLVHDIPRILESVLCSSIFISDTTVPNTKATNKMKCVWTGDEVRAGDRVFRIRMFTRNPKKDTQGMRICYVSRTPGSNPELYVQELSTLRAYHNWHCVLARKLFEWQRRESFSESTSGDMRMQRFLTSKTAADAISVMLAEFFAMRYVAHHLGGV